MNHELDDFIKRLGLSQSATTCYRKRHQVKAFLKRLAKPPEAVTREDVEAYLAGLPVLAESRRSACRAIAGFFEFAGVSPNPAEGIVFHVGRRVRITRPPGVTALCAVASDALTLRERVVLELAYGSGLRRAELCGLNIEDIDLKERIVFVTGKGGKVRYVPLTGKAVEAVRGYLACRREARGPLLLNWRRRRLGVTGLYLLCRTKLGHRPHLLRHACAAHMLQGGANIRAIQELLGHKKLTATQCYTALNSEDLRGLLERTHPRGVQKGCFMGEIT